MLDLYAHDFHNAVSRRSCLWLYGPFQYFFLLVKGAPLMQFTCRSDVYDGYGVVQLALQLADLGTFVVAHVISAHGVLS